MYKVKQQEMIRRVNIYIYIYGERATHNFRTGILA